MQNAKKKKGVSCGTLKEYFIKNIFAHFEQNIIATLLLMIMSTAMFLPVQNMLHCLHCTEVVRR